jgi:hypothetical protein
MSLCDNPMEPFLMPPSHPAGYHDYADGGGGGGGEGGYPCDIYENPSEHYAALGEAGQLLLYPGSHADSAEEEAQRRRMVSGQPPPPPMLHYFSHGKSTPSQIFRFKKINAAPQSR